MLIFYEGVYFWGKLLLMPINKIKTGVEVSSTKNKLSQKTELVLRRGERTYGLFILLEW